jgi:hypothetical protein
MTIETKAIKIGELLVSARLLDTGDVIEAIQVSHRLQIPIGRVLIMAGTVSEQLLQASLQAQIVVNEGLVPLDLAGEALRIVASEQKSLQQAFQQLNIPTDDKRDLSNQLVDLLLDSNIVSQGQLDRALRTSQDADIPLSGALVLQGSLSQNFFPSILRAHEQIRSGERTREESIEELKASFMIWLRADESWSSLSEALQSESVPSTTDRFLSFEPEIMSVTLDLDPTTNDQTPDLAGDTPAEVEARISADLTSSADVTTSAEEATSADASAAVEEAISAEAATAGETAVPPSPSLIELYKQAGVCTQQQVQKGYEDMLNDPHLSGRVFLAMGLTDEETLQFALRCHGLIKKGLLTEKQAVNAIRSMRSGTVSQEDALGQQTSKQHPYFERKWRNKTLRAVGGGLVGALVAGIALSKTFRGR